MDVPDVMKNKSSNLAVQKKKQFSNLSTTTENSEKLEVLAKNNKKLSSTNIQSLDDKVEENKKVTVPSTKNSNVGNGNENSNNDNINNNDNTTNDKSDNLDENQKKSDFSSTTIKFNLNPQKFKYFEFHDNEEPSFIINTFLNKLLISNKEDDNESFIKTDTTDTEDEEIQNKENKETVIPTIDKLDPNIQNWVINDIKILLDSFSEKLDYFKKRDENQRLALQNYNNNIIQKQLALKQLQEEQMNLNKKLQNEIKNSKWVLQNLAKFNEVTNEVIDSTGVTPNNPLISSEQQQDLSQQSSQQQLSSPQQNYISSDTTLSTGNKNDSKVNNDNTAIPIINITK